jgi:hypothetical protein
MELAKALREGHDEVRLLLQEPGFLGESVQVVVRVDQYPELTMAKEGTTIWVAGTISEFIPIVHGLTLSGAKLRISAPGGS